MRLRKIGRLLAEEVSPQLAEDWDNIGWMIGPLEEELEGVAVCVDPAPEVLEFALDNGCNLILAHHPLFFEEIRSLTSDDPLQRMAMEAVARNIGIYAMHTNADSCPGGLNDIFADYLHLEGTKPLVENETVEGAGLGRVGSFPAPTSLDKIIAEISSHPRINHLQTVRAGDEEISEVALCTGSGGDLLGKQEVLEADLFISGDLKHHQLENARMHGLNILNLDHYEMETVFLNFADRLLEDKIAVDCPVHLFERENPYHYHVRSTVLQKQEVNQ